MRAEAIWRTPWLAGVELCGGSLNRQVIIDHFFFFQAEDGIRDYKVTGVQTCALPISRHSRLQRLKGIEHAIAAAKKNRGFADRKSTRLNSSHLVISYAVFCLKKKKKDHIRATHRTKCRLCSAATTESGQLVSSRK